MKQQGSVLIISLMLLLVMTIIGVSSMQNSMLEEKMAANEKNQKLTFQDAETSLTRAENILFNMPWANLAGNFPQNGQPPAGYYSTGTGPADYRAENWVTGTDCIGLVGLDLPPNGGGACYKVEEIDITTANGQTPLTPAAYGQPGTGSSFLRAKITTRSTDANGLSAVILQSGVRKTIQ